MKANKLTFSIYQVIMSNSEFNLQTFADIQDDDTESHTIKSGGEEEVLSIKKITKEILGEGRFVAIYINEGKKYPYADKVIDSTDADLSEKNNPRSANLIEPDDQFFALLDIQTQRLFISDQRKKKSFNSWLNEKTSSDFTIKSLISEDQFLDTIKFISEISFTASPTLFNGTNSDTLSENLVRDIYGYGAEKASIKLTYNNKEPISTRVLNKLKSLIGHKEEFDDIVVIGRNEQDFESVFNIEGIINKILVNVSSDMESTLLDPQIVFNLLINEINTRE